MLCFSDPVTAKVGRANPLSAAGLWRSCSVPYTRSLAVRFYISFAILMLVLVPVEFALAEAVHLQRVGQELADSWLGLSMIVACVIYARWRPLPKLIDAAQITAISCLTLYVMGVLIHISGRSPYHLADQQLADVDALMHFQTVSFTRLVASWPIVRQVLEAAYGMTGMMVIAAAILPASLGRAEYSYRFVLAIISAVIITALLFYRWPAVGPWTVEGFAPDREQAAVESYLLQLRSAASVMSMKSVGIVSFPSFHTVMAITSAYALQWIPRVRWLIWIMCILICVSTITTGWHYGVDVLGGVGVATASILIANRILKLPRSVTTSR